jgi:hypothetical protein
MLSTTSAQGSKRRAENPGRGGIDKFVLTIGQRAGKVWMPKRSKAKVQDLGLVCASRPQGPQRNLAMIYSGNAAYPAQMRSRLG